jgi:hypothetical protein
MDMNNDDHQPIIVPITITRIMRRAMLKHSVKIPGCKRKDEGSISHFAFHACVKMLKEYGLDLKKLNAKY